MCVPTVEKKKTAPDNHDLSFKLSLEIAYNLETKRCPGGSENDQIVLDTKLKNGIISAQVLQLMLFGQDWAHSEWYGHRQECSLGKRNNSKI